MSKDEESFPTVISRPHDTLPSPPDFLGLDGDKPVRVSANGRAAFELSFPGGEVTPRKPTAAELVLSAKQWATSIREDMTDNWCEAAGRVRERTLSKVLHLEAVLSELSGEIK